MLRVVLAGLFVAAKARISRLSREGLARAGSTLICCSFSLLQEDTLLAGTLSALCLPCLMIHATLLKAFFRRYADVQ